MCLMFLRENTLKEILEVNRRGRDNYIEEVIRKCILLTYRKSSIDGKSLEEIKV